MILKGMNTEPKESSMTNRGTMPRQRHRSADEWRTLVSAWRASGKSSPVWCAEQGISRESLRRWKKRIGQSTCQSGMVELPRAALAIGLRVKLTRHGELEFSGGLTVELIRVLVGALREPGRVR
jgi:hypothetical protein